MNLFNKRYAALLAVDVVVNYFDGGENVRLTAHGENSSVTWNGSCAYGDEEQFNRRITRWLNTLPWPQEDDPRVEHKGEYA